MIIDGDHTSGDDDAIDSVGDGGDGRDYDTGDGNIAMGCSPQGRERTLD